MPAKKTETKPTQAEPNKIVFKLLKNVMLGGLADYMGGVHPAPPMQIKEHRQVVMVDNEALWNPVTGTYHEAGKPRHPMICTFDMDEEFEIELDNLDPRPVDKPPGMPDAFHARLVEREYDRAITARNRAEELRRLLLHYSQGEFPSIQIVRDDSSFLQMEAFLTDAEFERMKDAQHRERFVAGKL